MTLEELVERRDPRLELVELAAALLPFGVEIREAPAHRYDAAAFAQFRIKDETVTTPRYEDLTLKVSSVTSTAITVQLDRSVVSSTSNTTLYSFYMTTRLMVFD